MSEKGDPKKVIIAVKKWNQKGGKLYGPYPKVADEFYLYEETNGQIRYLGRGKKPKDAIIKEVTTVTDFFTIGRET